MALTKSQCFELALANISRYGDTDVFPYPIENLIFYDEPNDARAVLTEIDASFEKSLQQFPPVSVKSLSAVGYSGFRWATQIDPIWNAYLLAQVILIGDDIEKARVPTDRNVVFSYRYQPNQDTSQIFDVKIGWIKYQEHSVELARKYAFVLECDISDFYPRIYHHRVENALKKATKNSESTRRIMEMLGRLSDGIVSYGLPIGGPASRILSELLLNRIDRLLLSENINFCRFVDDFHIFANSREEAYRHLVFLSEILLVNEGLSLQKTKTRILTSKDFLAQSSFAVENQPDSPEAAEAQRFSRIRLYFDPYSPTAEDDYEALKDELSKFDIVAMLARELAKSRIDEGLTRRLVSAVKHLSTTSKNQAVSSLIRNLDVLYPVFPTVMLLLRAVMDDIEDGTKIEVFRTLRNLINGGSYITQVPANLSFALRVLSHDKSDETDALLAKLFKQPLNMMLKRDIILLMANRGADYWISNCGKQYKVLTPWERRALIISSYLLEDEGNHFRKGIKDEVSPMDRLALKWAGNKKGTSGGSWNIPV